MFLNNLIIIFIIYYSIFVIKVLEHIHFYESYFVFVRANLFSYLFKYSYSGITLLDLVMYFSKKIPQSHISNLMNFKYLPEVFQHARSGTELIMQNSNIYYHISAEHQGYDGFSFNKKDFQRILEEKNLSLITFYEKKMVSGGSLKLNKVIKVVETYSVPKVEGLELNKGARPCPVNQLEFGVYSLKDYNALKDLDLFKLKEPSIVIENYSNIYEVMVPHPKHFGGLGHGTIINDAAFEHLKYFYHLLENDEKMCSDINNLLENNPFFPL